MSLFWEHGTCWIHGMLSGKVHEVPARRHRLKGNVQFILWKAGEQGHKKDFWYDLEPSHWPYFKRLVKATQVPSTSVESKNA